MSIITRSAFAVAAVLAVAGPAPAGFFVLSTAQSRFDAGGSDNQGWYSDANGRLANNDRTFVGRSTGIGGFGEYRSFFVFDRSFLPTGELVVAATVVVRPQFAGPADNPERVGLFDVSTPARDLVLGTGLNPAYFADLGTGTGYGEADVSPFGGTARLGLNAAAVADLNAGRGFFGVGARLLSISRGQGQDEYVLSGNAPVQLELTTVTVPVPATVWLAGAGAGLMAVARRRLG